MEPFKTPKTREYYLSVVKQLEDKFSRKRKLKLEAAYKHNNEKSIRNFIEERCQNDIYWTKYVSSNKNQCAPSCYRSVGDLYMLCLYYYPELTVDEFLDELVEAEHLGCSYCYDVKKRVFSYGAYYDDKRRDENGLSSEFYDNLKNGIYHA